MEPPYRKISARGAGKATLGIERAKPLRKSMRCTMIHYDSIPSFERVLIV